MKTYSLVFYNKTEKEYEINYLIAKYDNKIKKYEYVLRLLDKFPNVKGLCYYR